MVLETAPDGGGEARAGVASRAVVWHDLECGTYTADMPLWRELAFEVAERSGSRPVSILDVGAGSGRVSIALAGDGHRMTSLDIDRELLLALCDRAGGLEIETVCADARTFELPQRAFDACFVPMQTIQLLGGAEGRASFLSQARRHLQPGGLLACAIVTELEPFDVSGQEDGPAPEVALLGGERFTSRAVCVRVGRRTIVIERERAIERDAPVDGAGVPVHSERDVIGLDRVSARLLGREMTAAGFSDVHVREVPATNEHVGSEVVLANA